jgi:hypothetical protein
MSAATATAATVRPSTSRTGAALTSMVTRAPSGPLDLADPVGHRLAGERRAGHRPLGGGDAAPVEVVAHPVLAVVADRIGQGARLAPHRATGVVQREHAARRCLDDEDGRRHLVEHRPQERALASLSSASRRSRSAAAACCRVMSASTATVPMTVPPGS